MPRQASSTASARRRFTSDEIAGLACGVAAFTIWSLTPFYFREMTALGPVEMVAHRILWSAVFLVPVLTVGRLWPAVAAAFATPRVLATLFASAAINATNWSIFVWSVMSDHLIAAALGYYLSPLFSVAFGQAFLREKLSRLQWLALACAAAGVTVRFVTLGELPWIGLAIGAAFGIYGLLRKTVAAGSAVGLFTECVMIGPFCLAYLVWRGAEGRSAFGSAGLGFDAAIAAAGVITAVPLLLYAMAARRVQLATVGVMQYIAPSVYLVMATWLFGEPFGAGDALAFGLIWLALLLYTIEIWRTRVV
jgi:chloramphenicol-sensitive protein RarD